MKGTRLEETWKLPEEWRNWAIAERPDLDVSKIAEEFKDYWISKTGQAATKCNWLATWRNWIRRQRDFRKPEVKPMSHQAYKSERISKDEWVKNKAIGRKHIEDLRRSLRGG